MGEKIFNPESDQQLQVDKEWWKIWKNRRTFLSFMAFLGITTMYMQRMNMSIAVVALTSVRNITNPETGLIESKAEFAWTNKQKNFILSSFFIGYIISMLPTGILVKKISPTTVFGAGVLASSLITILTPMLAQSYTILVISRIIAGIFQGVIFPCLLAFWKTWAPPFERARLHAFAINGVCFGIVITLPLSGELGEKLGWRSIFYVTGTIGCLWYITWLAFVSRSPETDPFISERERTYIFATVGAETDSVSLPIPWRSILTSLPVWALIVAAYSWEWGFVTIATQLPSFFDDVIDLDLGKNGALSSIPYITMAVFGFFTGYICDKVLIKGWLNITQVRKCFISIALLFQLLFFMFFAHSSEPALVVVLLTISVAFGAFIAAGFGTNYVDVGPAFASITGAIGNTIVTTAGIFSPIVTGFIVQSEKDGDLDALKFEWRIVWYICGAIYLAGAIFYWVCGSGEVQPWARVEPKVGDKEMK